MPWLPGSGLLQAASLAEQVQGVRAVTAGSGPEPSGHLSWSRCLLTPAGFELIPRMHRSEVVPVLTDVGPKQQRRACDLPFQCLHQLPCRIEVADPARFVERRRDLVGQAPAVARLNLAADLAIRFRLLNTKRSGMGHAIRRTLFRKGFRIERQHLVQRRLHCAQLPRAT